jgi:hypothetical protein
MKCECCGKNEAVVKDFREQAGCLCNFLVCKLCLWRSDKGFFAKMRATSRKVAHV